MDNVPYIITILMLVLFLILILFPHKVDAFYLVIPKVVKLVITFKK